MLWIHPMFFLPSNLDGVSLVRRAQRWWSGDVRIVKARRRRGGSGWIQPFCLGRGRNITSNPLVNIQKAMESGQRNSG